MPRTENTPGPGSGQTALGSFASEEILFPGRDSSHFQDVTSQPDPSKKAAGLCPEAVLGIRLQGV